MVFLKEFFQKVGYEKKISRQRKHMKNYPVGNKLMQEYVLRKTIEGLKFFWLFSIWENNFKIK